MNGQLDVISRWYDSPDLKVTILNIGGKVFNVEFWFKTTNAKVYTLLTTRQLTGKLCNLIMLEGLRGREVEKSKENIFFMMDEFENITPINKCIVNMTVPERFYTAFEKQRKVMEMTCN
jgi:hypothetical protein